MLRKPTGVRPSVQDRLAKKVGGEIRPGAVAKTNPGKEEKTSGHEEFGYQTTRTNLEETEDTGRAGQGRDDLRNKLVAMRAARAGRTSKPEVDVVAEKMGAGLRIGGKDVEEGVGRKVISPVKASSTPGATTAPSKAPLRRPAPLAEACLCLRPLKLVMCQLCGETFPARKQLACSVHPGDLYLLDIKACIRCRQRDLTRLLEYPLPPGMMEVMVKRNLLLKK